MLIFQRKFDKFRILLNCDDFWPIDFIDAKLTKKQMKYYNTLNSLFKISFSCSLSVVVLSFVKAYITEKKIPFEIYPIVDFKEFPYLQIFYIMLIVYDAKIVCFVFGMDGLFYSVLCVLYCQIKMMKHALRNFDMEYVDEDGEKRSYQKIIFFNKHFEKLLE